MSAATPPSVTPKLEVTTPGETTHTLSLIPPTLGEEPFLDIPKAPYECGRLQENEVIVTLILVDFDEPSPDPPPIAPKPKGYIEDKTYHLLGRLLPSGIKRSYVGKGSLEAAKPRDSAPIAGLEAHTQVFPTGTM